jgi:ribosomal protein L7Ae-like RNA K-turn-binding protein
MAENPDKARQKLLSMLGLCRKAGKLKSGFDQCGEALREGLVSLVVLAENLSPKTKKEARFLAAKHKAGVVEAAVSIDDIDSKTGRRAGVLAVTDKGFAAVIEELAASAARFEEELLNG